MKYKTVSPGAVHQALNDRFQKRFGRRVPEFTTPVNTNPNSIDLPDAPANERTHVREYIGRLCEWLTTTSDEELAAATLANKIRMGDHSGQMCLVTEVLDIFCYVRGLKKR